MLWMDGNARHGTHLHALRFVKVAYALGAFVGVDLVDLRPQKNSFVWALWLAHIAVNAFVGDHQSHMCAPYALSCVWW